MQIIKDRDGISDTKAIWFRLIAAISGIHTLLSTHTSAYTCSFDACGIHVCTIKCWPDEVMLCYNTPGDSQPCICHFYTGEEINYKLIRDTIMSSVGQLMKYKPGIAALTS